MSLRQRIMFFASVAIAVPAAAYFTNPEFQDALDFQIHRQIHRALVWASNQEAARLSGPPPAMRREHSEFAEITALANEAAYPRAPRPVALRIAPLGGAAPRPAQTATQCAPPGGGHRHRVQVQRFQSTRQFQSARQF